MDERKSVGDPCLGRLIVEICSNVIELQIISSGLVRLITFESLPLQADPEGPPLEQDSEGT